MNTAAAQRQHYAEVARRIGLVPRITVVRPIAEIVALYAPPKGRQCYDKPIGPRIPPHKLPGFVSIRDRVRMIAEHHGFSLSAIWTGQSEELVRVRAVIAHHLACPEGDKFKPIGVSAIGRHLKRDHTAIMNLLAVRDRDGNTIARKPRKSRQGQAEALA